MPSKKLLTPDKTVELPIKKQCTGSPSSEPDNDRAGKHKEKKKKKEVKSEPTVATMRAATSFSKHYQNRTGAVTQGT